VDLCWSWVFKKHDACSKFALLASHCPKKKKEGEASFIHEWYGYGCNFCALSRAGRVHFAALNKTHPRYFFPTPPDRLCRHYLLPVLASSFRPCRNLSKGAFLVSFFDRSLIQSAMRFMVLKIGSASGFSLSQSPNSQSRFPRKKDPTIQIKFKWIYTYIYVYIYVHIHICFHIDFNCVP